MSAVKWQQCLERLHQSPEIEASAIRDGSGNLVAVCATGAIEEVLSPMLTTLLPESTDQTAQDFRWELVDILMSYGSEGWLVAQMINDTQVLAVLYRAADKASGGGTQHSINLAANRSAVTTRTFA